MSNDDGDDPDRSITDNPKALSKEMVRRFSANHPKISSTVQNFISNPFSGDTIEAIVTDRDVTTRDPITTLETPTMWQNTSQIVISQFVNYKSQNIPQYWTTTLPGLEEQYRTEIRYEHHDIPTPQKGSLDYKLATVGRAIQHSYTDELFWKWFNSVMIDGVSNMDDAYDTAEQIIPDGDISELQTAVEEDLFRYVFEDEINTLFGRLDTQEHSKLDEYLQNGEPVFMIFINGVAVQASFDVMVGVIEEL